MGDTPTWMGGTPISGQRGSPIPGWGYPPPHRRLDGRGTPIQVGVRPCGQTNKVKLLPSPILRMRALKRNTVTTSEGIRLAGQEYLGLQVYALSLSFCNKMFYTCNDDCVHFGFHHLLMWRDFLTYRVLFFPTLFHIKIFVSSLLWYVCGTHYTRLSRKGQHLKKGEIKNLKW